MSRLPIQKTYKLFIGGKFPRTESGRFYPVRSEDGSQLANACLASRKDIRNAVVAARKAQVGWAARTAYNRSQILYRLAEMLETRSHSFVDELMQTGLKKAVATKEVERAIDRLIYYAGWCDKYTALFSSVNPTASAHFNFSMHEATGVVTATAPEDHSLLGLISVISPVIAGGNTIVVLASESQPMSAMSFAEVIQNSDVPGGVINILTGSFEELGGHLASHMDVNAFISSRAGLPESEKLKVVPNVKRFIDWSDSWDREEPYTILDIQEVKTTWHPVQQSSGSGGGY